MDSVCLATDGNIQLDEGGNDAENSMLVAGPEAKSLLKGVTVSRYTSFT